MLHCLSEPVPQHGISISCADDVWLYASLFHCRLCPSSLCWHSCLSTVNRPRQHRCILYIYFAFQSVQSVSERVSRFPTAHQHIKGHFVPSRKITRCRLNNQYCVQRSCTYKNTIRLQFKSSLKLDVGN